MPPLLLAILLFAQSTSPHAALGVVQPTSRALADIDIVTAPSVPTKRGAGPSEREELGPDISAQSAVVIDGKSGVVLFGKRPYAVRPFASMTKLLSALALVRTNPDWGASIDILPEDIPAEGNTVFRAGDRVRLRDAFTAMLVRSDNAAARALVRVQFPAPALFRAASARVATELRLHAMTVREPTGLDAVDRGTAVDAAQLLRAALEEREIRDRLGRGRAVIAVSGPQARNVIVTTTNRLLRLRLPGVDWASVAGKTGYIDESGYNFVMAADRAGQRVIVAVLGATTHEDRFRDAAVLAGWVFENYTWPAIVRAEGRP